MAEDAKFLKRKIRGGSVDVHPSEKALIVHYETEATIIGEDGTPMIGDRKECQKIIRVKNLNEKSDIPELARKIVDNCRLLSEDKLVEIEHLLKYLLKRKDSASKKTVKKPNTSEKLADPGAFDSTEIDEVAQLGDLDEYLELLYEDIPEKLRASALILQLARNPDNLEELFQNETLVGALARVLREDWKESIDLATNITYIFFCFSSFSNFHGVILHFKIGALTMTIIENELRRYEALLEELETKKAILSEASKSSDSSTALESQKSYERTANKFATLKRKQEQLFRVSFYLLLNISEDLNVEMKMHNKGIISLLSQCLDRDNFELLILLVSFLKKLSIFRENINEMIKHRVIEKLCGIICRPEVDLVNITLRLLLNLSFETNARKLMVKHSLIDKLVKIAEASEDNRPMALYILYHLSIEDESKPEFLNTNCLQLLIRLALADPNTLSDLIPMAIAINLALEERCATIFAEGKSIKHLMKRALRMRDPLLMKLLKNISQHGQELKRKFIDFIPNLAEAIVKGPLTCEKVHESSTIRESSKKFNSDLHLLDPVDRGQQNTLSLKERHILTTHQQIEQNYLLECLSCLANLSVRELDFGSILCKNNLLTWIKKKLNESDMHGYVSHIENATISELMKLLETACQNTESAKLIVSEDIVPLLVDVLNGKQEDDIIVSRIIHIFYQLVFHRDTIETVVRSTDIPAYLIDLMHDKNKTVRQLCEISLNIIAEFDKNWGSRIQAERFRWHNSQWLEMIDSASNPIKIKTDPITDAAIAAAFANGHSRVRRHNLPQGDLSPDISNTDADAELTDPFGFECAVDDAAAFLMTLSNHAHDRKESASSERSAHSISTDTSAHPGCLKSIYPDLYEDHNLMAYKRRGVVSPDESASDSILSSEASESP